MLFAVAIGIALVSVAGAVISLVALEGALAVVAAVAAVAAGGALGGLMSLRARRLAARVLEMSAAAASCDKLEADISFHDKRFAAILAKQTSGTRDGVIAAAGELDRIEKDLEKARLESEALTKELGGIAESAAAAAVDAARHLSQMGIAAGTSLGGALSARLGGAPASRPVTQDIPGELFSDVADAAETRELFAPLFARTRESDEAASELAKIRAGKETLASRTRLLLGGRSREAVEKEAGMTADRVEDESLLSEAEIPAGRRKVDEAESGINELEVQLADVSARVGEGLKNLPEAAVLEERLESLTRRHRLQTFYRSALEEAARVVKEAAGSFHERIYPEVEKRLGGLLERLTNGVHGGASISCDKDGLPEFNVRRGRAGISLRSAGACRGSLG